MSTPENVLQVDEAELRRATDGLVQAYHDTLPQLLGGVADAIERVGGHFSDSLSRRRFVGGSVTGAALLASGGLISACGAVAPSANASNISSHDTQLAQLFGLIESTSLQVYKSLSTKSTLGHLGPGSQLSPITDFITVVEVHHTGHEAAWNSVLGVAGKAAVAKGAVDSHVNTAAQAAVTAAATLAEGISVALTIEQTLMATYLASASQLASAPLMLTALRLAPVEAQHAAVLELALGSRLSSLPPFAPTGLARSVSDLS